MLREMRQARDLTLQDVADKLNLDRTTIGKWELGLSFPRPDVAQNLAALYGCSMDDLYNAWNKARSTESAG